MAEPIEGLVLLAIDSHTASVSAETLTWLTDKAKAARNNGKQVIAMMHHPLFPHITGGDMYVDTYTVGDYATVRDALIEAGVNTILTGHFHTSDIAKDWNDDEAKGVYDINTGSLISYPCDYRILTPSADLKTLDVKTASIVPEGMTADECKTWLQGRIKSVATKKMNAKAGAMATTFATQINNIAEFAANLFVLHAEGDENKSAYRDLLETTYTTYKDDGMYSAMLTAGGITDASIYSVLDDVSNYGTDKADVTKDRTLTINLPEVGPFKPTEPGTITIGSGESYTDLPLTAQYKYALTQQVFSANEINHAKGKIWSIAFRTKKGDLTRKLTVYVTHTDQSSLSSYSWQPVTATDCYFSGEVMFTSGQWNTIYFDKPFEYDGKSNIVVTVDDNTGRADGWGALTNAYFYGDGNHAIARDNSKDIDPLDATSIENASQKNSYDYKNQIQFVFGDYPTPANFAVTDIGDVSAVAQCSLRGEAAAWNLRYRKVAGEGEEEQAWITQSGIDASSFTMTGLTAFTKYEAQVQAVFAEDKLSEWTDPVVFTTNCCPVNEQAEIIYAVNSNNSSWYGYAIQFMDVTDEEHPFEVAYINPVDYSFTGGTITLCCGHKYKVNWIFDAEHENVNGSFSLALFFEPGDQFYSMAMGEAPSSTSELTTFVMDCTPYCVQMPQIVNEAGTTYNSATLTFVSQTKTGQVVYSTEEDFDPETATPVDADFEELPQSDVPWEQPNASVTLKGLQPLTTYYVSVRSVCTIEPLSTSRWTKLVKVTTGSRYDAPSQVIAEPENSRTENLSWGSRGNETGYNLYYREQAAGNPVDPSAIQTFGGGNGTGFDNGSWGDGIWSSYGDRPFSNTVFVSDVPAGSSFCFKAGNGKTGAGQTKFLYGMQKLKKDGTPLEQMKKFDKKCLNDADRAAIIKELQNKIKELTDEQQIAAYNAEIEELNSLPTDAQKLEQMRTLEKNIEDNVAALDALAQKNANGEITDEEFKSQSDVLKAQNALYGAELSELRAITINAEDPNNDGFSINSKQESANAPRRAPGDATYIFFIRHNDPNGVLLVKDLTITPPELVNEWIKVPNITGTEYTLTGLESGTTYEVMVEPVYDNGTTGTQSPITVFTTLGTETDPTESEFSVSENKKVQFAKGNLQYSGDSYGMEGKWSMAKQQYEILGEKNISTSGSNTYPTNPHDLFCWSTVNNYCGVTNYYYEDNPDAYFKGDFVDWGTDAKLASALGSGWSTLTKNEWSYLLTDRENAATKKAIVTITLDAENSVKGLLLLPDEWTAPDGVPVIDGSATALTLEQWTALETAGAVFLPAAGQMTSTNEGYTTTTLTPAGTYWTATPSDDASGLKAMILSFDDENVTLDADLNRRVMTAVRLVKAFIVKGDGDANGDGKVDIDDAEAIMDYLLGNPPAGFDAAAADVNGDGVVDIADAVAMLDIIMNSGGASAPKMDTSDSQPRGK